MATSLDYEQQILNAIQIMVNSAIEKSNFDITISAYISQIVDADKGIYTIKYQDNIFTAYTIDTTRKYAVNDFVYVLLPNGDINANKLILCPIF